jgi:hypothetical protein
VARSHESLWLWTGAAFTAVGAALMGIAGGLDAASKMPYSLWTSFPMIVAYVMFGVAFACLVCAVRGVPFPFAIDGQDGQGSITTLTAPVLPPVGVALPERPTAAPEASQPPEPRAMCPLSPKELMRLYSQGATELQGESLVAQYKGQWREVPATVELVTPQNEIVFTVTAKDSDEVSVIFLFRVVWTARFKGIEIGDEIRVMGRVTKVTSAVFFDHCELI